MHVEQPRACAPSAARERVDRRRVAPLGEVRHGLERHARAYSRSVKAYYDRRAPEYDEWYRGTGRFAERDRPGWDDEVARPAPRARRRCRPRARSTSPAAPASSRAISAARSSGLDQSDVDARGRAPPGARSATLRPGRRARAAVRGRLLRPRLHRHFYGHLEDDERERFLAEARRVAPSSSSSTRRPARGRRARGAAGADPERRLALGGLQALLRGRGSWPRSSAAARPLRRPLVRRRPRLTRRRSRYRSLASLQRDNRVCRACAEAGFPLESLPVVAAATPASARTCSARRPASSRARSGRPWRGRAGQTLRRWLELDEDEFYATFYCASVTRCYPGKRAGGRGDRTPTPREQELCAFWREWELALLRPG